MKYCLKLAMAFFVLAAFACEPTQKIDKEALAASKRAQEIKKLSQADITEAAFNLGRALSTRAKKSFQLLRDSVCIDTPPDSLQKYCEARGLSEKDTMYFTKNVVINRFTIYSKDLTTIENQLLEAYIYNANNDVPFSDNVQKLDKAYLYTQPIVQEEMGCMRCLKIASDSISSEALIGMWSITIPSQELIVGM